MILALQHAPRSPLEGEQAPPLAPRGVTAEAADRGSPPFLSLPHKGGGENKRRRRGALLWRLLF